MKKGKKGGEQKEPLLLQYNACRACPCAVMLRSGAAVAHVLRVRIPFLVAADLSDAALRVLVETAAAATGTAASTAGRRRRRTPAAVTASTRCRWRWG